MKLAPSTPTTEQLRSQYGIPAETELAVLQECGSIAAMLDDHQGNLLAIIGSCAMTNEPAALKRDNDQIAAIATSDKGLRTLHRIPPWKPRSNPDDWHGLETTEPEAAYKILASLATKNANVAIELADRQHINRYGPMISFGWIGSRNSTRDDLLATLALRDPKLPLGIKNGIDGNIECAFEQAQRVNRLRSRVENPAPAVMIYRGGENVQDPQSWQEQYLRALELTEGQLIVDVAHGAEMAHDPSGKFKKSAEGQSRALQAVLNLAEQGYFPAGIMLEASDIEESPTDPTISLAIALKGVQELHALKVGKRIKSLV